MTAAAACPRLRPLEIFPTELEGRRVICLRDPSGLTDQVAFLPEAAVTILSLCDGRRDLAEVAAEATRRIGSRIAASTVRQLLDQLDDGLFLDTPRFHAHHAQVIAEFRAQPVREPSHAGLSYSDDPGELAGELASHLQAARSRHQNGHAPAGLIAPHIDFTRGAPIYADAYLPLLQEAPALDLVIVFGTDHNGVHQPLTLTRKSYATPFGTVQTDVALVDALARAAGGDADDLFEEELHHRHEHSIEFQAVWLKHVLGARMPPMLPVLCGPLGERTRVREFVATLRQLCKGRSVLVIAGADLAHVGPRFGDGPFLDGERADVEAADRRALAALTRVDADGFHAEIAAENDRFRVCGIAPIYATLTYLADRPRRGALLGYAHCPADEQPASWVTIAAARIDDDMYE